MAGKDKKMENRGFVGMNFTKEWFLNLDRMLRDAGLDSDRSTFDEILKNLQKSRQITPEQFATECIYVILASGFSQKTAKIKHAEIMNYLQKAGKTPALDDLLAIFNNKNKMSAANKIWQKRREFCDGYYSITENHKSEIINQKLDFLSKLPHIGKITANHLARNLGENVVKYDIWIQRLGCVFANSPLGRGAGETGGVGLQSRINNGALNPDIKNACDDMFAHLEKETGLPRGYIDVVLWKACQNKLIKTDYLS